MIDNRFYVYVYKYPDGTPFYVGKGTKGRLKDHYRNALKENCKNSLTLNVIRKLVDNNQEPLIEKIIDNIESELACLIEEEYISKYGRRINNSGILTNITEGGEGVKGSSHNKGIKRTPEHIEIMRSNATGKKQSEETKRKKYEKLKGYVHKIITCPVCGKSGGETGMKRHHFDKCSGTHEIRARVYIDGKRYHVGRFSTIQEAEIAKKNFKENFNRI